MITDEIKNLISDYCAHDVTDIDKKVSLRRHDFDHETATYIAEKIANKLGQPSWIGRRDYSDNSESWDVLYKPSERLFKDSIEILHCDITQINPVTPVYTRSEAITQAIIEATLARNNRVYIAQIGQTNKWKIVHYDPEIFNDQMYFGAWIPVGTKGIIRLHSMHDKSEQDNN